jgi:hypothetical protein
MNGRKKAFAAGYPQSAHNPPRQIVTNRGRIFAIRPSLYNARGMPDPNQITVKEHEGRHGSQIPVGVLNRIIKASSTPGDVVLDPFNGSETTVLAAALFDRQYVGIDQSAAYVGCAQKRREHALQASDVNGNDRRPVVFDTKRGSTVMTKTDALRRPRVARRGPAAKSA